MIVFDRDGTIIGSLTDYKANDPRHIKCPEDQRIVEFIPEYLKSRSHLTMGILSNQNGIGHYKTLPQVIQEFEWLLEKLPELDFGIFSFCDGERAWFVGRGLSFQIEYPDLVGLYRKPSCGMFIAAERLMREPIGCYVGDLSGLQDYADGLATDKESALAFGINYIDVRALKHGCELH